MLNYVKSEFYRVTHTKALYMILAVLCGLVLLMNLVLMAFLKLTPGFRYGTFRFSLNTFTAQPMTLLIMGALVPALLFVDERRNGALKNAVAFGISRTGILLGKCVVCLCAALFILAGTLLVYIGSAYLLLENPEWLPVREMLSAVGAMLPAAIASMIFVIVVGAMGQKEIMIGIWWMVVFILIPTAVMILGLKLESFARLASWLPYAYLQNEAIVGYSTYDCLWDKAEGLYRCLLSGALGVIIFLELGILKFKKQDI